MAPYFRHLTTKVVECPNLGAKPFYLGRAGISGDATLANVGSYDYLIPCADHGKMYNFVDVARYSGISFGMVLGGGIGPFQAYQKPCECEVPISERASNNFFSATGQFFITEATPGKVIELKAAGRVNCHNIFDLIQKALYNKYSKSSSPVALGGVFFLQNSAVEVNLLNDLPKEPYHTFPCFKEFQTTFKIEGPIIGTGTIVSHDPNNQDLVTQSFYCWDTEKQLTGHFENDICPDMANYTVYLYPARNILRLDKPYYRK
ncbi:unnamed protein product [Mesocestoides corti]|uniref:DUF1907 domain-containing protein n=1 Tax=Mesocestoides corti TaxID=53468 RepID=A0A3P6H8X8_MESCO|nr:unnamed protein product [Mesocestoides corti]